MIKSTQRGESTISLLLSLALLFGSLYLIVSDYFPAQADDLQAVVSLASNSAEAKAELAASLSKMPNPNRKELREIQRRINDLVVTETARSVTGNADLKSPATLEAERKVAAAARIEIIGGKNLAEMTSDERYDYFSAILPIVVMVLGLLASISYGFYLIFLDRK